MNRCVAIIAIAIIAFLLVVPASAQVSIPCGTDATIQSAVNANPAGTTFNLAANCTYNFSLPVVPKSNDKFIGAGATSTIIDGGQGEHYGWNAGGAFPSGSGAATGVMISNMTIQNFGSVSAADSDFNGRAIFTADGWTIRDNRIINNVTAISEVGNGVTIINNQINNNRAYAIIALPGPFPSSTLPLVVQGNEIAGNNTNLWDTCNGSVNKYLDLPQSSGDSVQFLNNYVHDNMGAGYWYDSGNATTNLIQGNTFVRNGSGGIISEVTTGTFTVQNNVFIDNGNSSTQSASSCGRWDSYPDIWIHGSPNTTVQNNNISNERGPNSAGGSYGGMPLGISDDDCRGDSFGVDNNSIHDNTVTFKSAASGSGINSQSGTWGTWYACNAGYTHNGTFSNNNHFHVPGGSTSDGHFAWFPNWSAVISFSALQAAGQEAGGSIDTIDASVPGCTGPWPGASGVGICPKGSGWPATGAPVISTIALSNKTFAPNVANGAVGTVSVTMSDGSAFSGTLSITGTNSGGFHLSGNTLQEKASAGTPPGTYHDFNIVATEANISNSPQQVSPTVTGVVEAPFGGSARPITNLIQAEDYDLGGQGVAYNATETCGTYPSDSYRGAAGDGVNIDTTSDAGGGYKLGCNKAGDWHNYTITGPTTGTYTLNMRTANIEAGATYRVAIDGATVVSGIAVSNTGSYDTFATVTSKQFGLTTGQHVMQIVLDKAGPSAYGGDFNWVQGTLVKAGAIGAKNVDITVTH